jgi:hypothetical protein
VIADSLLKCGVLLAKLRDLRIDTPALSSLGIHREGDGAAQNREDSQAQPPERRGGVWCAAAANSPYLVR